MLQVFLCALVSQPACARLRGNIGDQPVFKSMWASENNHWVSDDARSVSCFSLWTVLGRHLSPMIDSRMVEVQLVEESRGLLRKKHMQCNAVFKNTQQIL